MIMKSALDTILVPIDFKESSLKVLKYAYHIANRIHCDIVLLYVIEIPGFLSDLFTSGDELVKITDKAKNKLNRIIGDFKSEYPDINISSKIEKGKPYVRILEVADELNAHMIILGENHQGDKKSKNLGTTVYHVSLKSTVPVLTFKGSFDHEVDNILVPLDLTKQTCNQVLSAMVYGLSYGARIHLVSALIGGIKMEDSRIYNKLQEAKQTLEKNNAKCEMKLFDRSDIPPYQRVLDYAEELNADIILVMTHQEGYTYDNYIGAFAHHIINESRVPVLSLTSSAANIDHQTILGPMVDPFGVFKNR